MTQSLEKGKIKMNGQLELELGAQTNESNKYKKVSDLDMYQQVAKQRQYIRENRPLSTQHWD